MTTWRAWRSGWISTATTRTLSPWAKSAWTFVPGLDAERQTYFYRQQLQLGAPF